MNTTMFSRLSWLMLALFVLGCQPSEATFDETSDEQGQADHTLTAPAVQMAGRGPVLDGRAVRGKPYNITATAQGWEFTSATLQYGSSPTALTQHLAMAVSGPYATVSLDIPSNWPGKLYYRIVDGAGRTIQAPNGVPFGVEVLTRVVTFAWTTTTEAHAAGTLIVRYCGPLTGPSTVLHFGWDGWTGAQDVAMDYQHPDGDYNEARVTVRAGSRLDFAVHVGNAWDNNAGADFHVGVRPFVWANLYQIPGDPVTRVELFYTNGSLAEPVFAHVGFDGWKNVSDLKMRKPTFGGQPMGYWDAYLNSPAGAQQLDLAFHDSQGHWLNNGGADWHFVAGR